ncbi:MAG: proton-conducting membrane transporter [Clostridia bacterium]|nr:proton-conducting membrane transporter [Clostridia bacterium]
MEGNLFLLIPVLLPILAGLGVGLIPALRERSSARRWTGLFLVLSSAAMAYATWRLAGQSLILWHLTASIPIQLSLDALSRFFLALVALMWPLAGYFAFEYMHHEEDEHRFYAFYLATQGVLSGLTMAGNLVTFYLFYEAMTLITLPLVLHTRTKEAIAAAIKYLIYSVFGASAALLGIFYLNHVCETLAFIPGGSLRLAEDQRSALLWVAFAMILGFGTKAGMFPLHGWLPTAHPVAPAPASAVLSGVITKMGVLGVIRVVYYCIGAEVLRGSWVQIAWMILALVTVFMGSMLALKEDLFKKRLAYSSVSQVSYVLFGLSTLTAVGFQGALLHVLFHSTIKITLFMTAGVVISKTGLSHVSDLKGLGKRMPLVLVLFTLVSLGLIGIPPTGGFVSKWFIASGAMDLGSAFSFIGPAVLLISAILTAAYLLTITIQGFFPGHDADLSACTPVRVGPLMWVPMLLLTLLVVFGGMFPGRFISFFQSIATAIV